MKKTEVIEYEKEDYDALDNMSKDEIISQLEFIKRGYLPQNYYAQDGSESDYENTKMHIAMRKAIEAIENM